jgi:hypothetical protein
VNAVLSRLAVVLLVALLSACSEPAWQRPVGAVQEPEAQPSSAPIETAPTANPGLIRVPRPSVPPGPRRIGLQAGHWLTDEVPDELRRLEEMTGTSAAGVAEWQVNLDIANRVATALRTRGFVVDVLPTTIPAGYLADVFISLHCDGSHDPGARGYKAAHSTRRGPYEDALLNAIVEEYGAATGLPRDSAITRGMLGYYAFNWRRYTASVAPHTPAAILEMGFLTSPVDRTLLVGRPQLVADGITRAILRFLGEVPAEKLFAEDLMVPAFRAPPRP